MESAPVSPPPAPERGGKNYPHPAVRYLEPLLQSKTLLWVCVGLALIMLSLILSPGKPNKIASLPRVRSTKAARQIASGEVLVKPHEDAKYRIEITPEMSKAHVVGNFTAYGGSTNAVVAMIMEQSQYENWSSGHDARAFYYSKGQKSSDDFDVALDPGIYSFVISNRQPKSATKYVYLELDLTYYQPEN